MKLSEFNRKVLEMSVGNPDPEIVFSGRHNAKVHYEESEPLFLKGWFHRQPHDDPHGNFRQDILEPLASEIGQSQKVFDVNGDAHEIGPAIYVGIPFFGGCDHDDFVLRKYPRSYRADLVREYNRMRACKNSG